MVGLFDTKFADWIELDAAALDPIPPLRLFRGDRGRAVNLGLRILKVLEKPKRRRIQLTISSNVGEKQLCTDRQQAYKARGVSLRYRYAGICSATTRRVPLQDDYLFIA